MESKINQAVSLLEKVKNNIENKNYQEVKGQIEEVYRIYQIMYGRSGLETLIIIDCILEICKDHIELTEIQNNYLEEREYLIQGRIESDFYD